MSTKIKTVEAGCPKCAGTGFHGEHPVPAQNPFCPDCNGRGRNAVPETDTEKCAECNGRGHVEHVPCPGCCHTGRLVTQSPVASKPGEDRPSVDAITLQLNDALEKIESLTKTNADLTAENADQKKTIKGLSKALKDAEKRPAPTERGPAKAADILAGVAGTSTTAGDAGTTDAPPLATS